MNSRRGRPITSLIDRFMLKVQKESSGCWRWIGAIDRQGYGKIRLGKADSYKTVGAHLASFQLFNGSIIKGRMTQVDHLCKNRLCVNPDHLEYVSAKTNVMRSSAANAVFIRDGRCKRGHDVTCTENVYIAKNGKRACRECSRLKQRERYWRNK